ncbi:hypothetical protein HK101_005429, partial [Irineochytrium annulatum]
MNVKEAGHMRPLHTEMPKQAQAQAQMQRQPPRQPIKPIAIRPPPESILSDVPNWAVESQKAAPKIGASSPTQRVSSVVQQTTRPFTTNLPSPAVPAANTQFVLPQKERRTARISASSRKSGGGGGAGAVDDNNPFDTQFAAAVATQQQQAGQPASVGVENQTKGLGKMSLASPMQPTARLQLQQQGTRCDIDVESTSSQQPAPSPATNTNTLTSAPLQQQQPYRYGREDLMVVGQRIANHLPTPEILAAAAAVADPQSLARRPQPRPCSQHQAQMPMQGPLVGPSVAIGWPPSAPLIGRPPVAASNGFMRPPSQMSPTSAAQQPRSQPAAGRAGRILNAPVPTAASPNGPPFSALPANEDPEEAMLRRRRLRIAAGAASAIKSKLFSDDLDINTDAELGVTDTAVSAAAAVMRELQLAQAREVAGRAARASTMTEEEIARGAAERFARHAEDRKGLHPALVADRVLGTGGSYR